MLHLQLIWSPLPIGDCEKSGHIVHCASPLSENVLIGQGLQLLTDSEALTFEKWPGPQGEHCVLFSSELKNPGEHK